MDEIKQHLYCQIIPLMQCSVLTIKSLAIRLSYWASPFPLACNFSLTGNDIQYLRLLISCDNFVWRSWSFILWAGGKRSEKLRWRLCLCQGEDSDLIMSSLVGPSSSENSARSRRSALLMTAAASGPSEARWALAGILYTLGSVNSNLSVEETTRNKGMGGNDQEGVFFCKVEPKMMQHICCVVKYQLL